MFHTDINSKVLVDKLASISYIVINNLS